MIVEGFLVTARLEEALATRCVASPRPRDAGEFGNDFDVPLAVRMRVVDRCCNKIASED